MSASESEGLSFAKYFDHFYVINLPTRPDRLGSIIHELNQLGIGVSSGKVSVPYAPMPYNDGGFPSRGVYGNFLSHLEILRDARACGYERVVVLEDDAIFRRSMNNEICQRELISALEAFDWTMWFGGHSLSAALDTKHGSIVPTVLPFRWAHCYAVHRRGIDDLIAYLEATMERPRGHPEGGRMYIDGAFSMFREIHRECICVVSNPPISVQKGTTSNLGQRKIYDNYVVLRSLVSVARSIRDEIWKWTGIYFL